MRHPEHVRRTLTVIAALIGAVGETVAIAASSPGSARWNEAAVACVVVAYGAVGVLILWHRPGHPIGRLAIVIAPIWGIGQALVATSYATLSHRPDSRPAALAMVVGSFLRGLPWLIAVLWLPLRFPDGQPVRTGLGRIAERTSIAAIAAFSLVALASPDLTDTRLSDVDSPIGLPRSLTPVTDAVAALLLLVGVTSVCLAVAVVVQRYRRGGALDRQQTLIFAAAFIPPVAALVASAWDATDPWVFGVGSIPLPVAIGVAVLQRRLYDLPLAVNRSLTYGALSLTIAALYAVSVGGIGSMLRQEGAAWLPWVAAGIVAVSFAPLRDGLQRAANRITYGQWAQPGEVLARTRRRVADAGDLRALLQSLADDLVEELGLDGVQVTNSTGVVLASSGAPADLVDELPLTVYGEQVGTLRWARLHLRDIDRQLMTELADQLGAVVHADGLLASVRSAQERLVLAREEERRRLRRDLHDGLGPTLAGLTLQVDTVRNQVAPNATTDAELVALRTGIQDAVMDVRRIVEGLRPAALDDLGLVDAVQVLAGRTAGLTVDVTAEDLGRPPAAVEVAAYRIVQEGLTNAVKHARASRASVVLRLGASCLEVQVSDDGTGELRTRADGVGLGSMRERAEEIGGSFEVCAEAGVGTTVRARLPLSGNVRR